MRRRPTRAAGAVAACGALLVLMSGPAQATWLAVIGALVLGVPLASMTMRNRLDHADVELDCVDRARVGDVVGLVVQVHARGGPVPLHRLAVEGGPFGSLDLLVDPVARGQRAEAQVDAVVETRGLHDGAPYRAGTGAAFGLIRTSRPGVASCRIEVGAALVDVAPQLLRAVTGATDDAVERRRGGGDEVHAVRDYRTGDAMRDVHWRSTARAGRLVVKDYERPVPTRSAVAVAGGAPGPAFEGLVSAAASVAQSWWRSGEPVDAVRLDPDGAPLVVRGASQYGLHSWSAAIQPVGGDLRAVCRMLLGEVRPTTVVLAVGPGAEHVAEACSDLLSAGSAVLVVSLPGLVQPLPIGVVHRVLDPDLDVARVLAGTTL
ncbi:MAG TPA: DUF58 domain-containing protein [Mycobacteriales bacterium]|nr:DUF58 domain-containing protein [Mycobacteriales bacterium]